MNNDCVIAKLVTGEQFMAQYVDAARDYVILKNLIAIRVVPVMGPDGIIDKTVTAPFCSMTEDPEYSFNLNHVVYCKPLHSKLVPYYHKLLDAFLKEEQEETEEIDEDNLMVFELDQDKIH